MSKKSKNKIKYSMVGIVFVLSVATLVIWSMVLEKNKDGQKEDLEVEKETVGYSLEELFPENTVGINIGDFNRITGRVDTVAMCKLFSVDTDIGIGLGYNPDETSPDNQIKVDENGGKAGDMAAEGATWKSIETYRTVGRDVLFCVDVSYSGLLNDTTMNYPEVDLHNINNEGIEKLYYIIEKNKLIVRMKPIGIESFIDVSISTLSREEQSIESVFKDEIEDVVKYVAESFEILKIA